MKKKLILCLAGITTFSLLTACGNKGDDYFTGKGETASTNSYYATEDVYEYAACETTADYEESYYEEYESTTEAPEVQDTGRKLISTVSLDVETKEFETLIPNIEKKVLSLGGYIESSYTYNGSYYSSSVRSANLTIRIPAKNLDSFVAEIDTVSNITHKNTQVEDVTLAYVDMESRKNALLIEQENLLAMLEMAETIDDMILIESRMSEVRYQLESMESQLRTYDNKIDYATIYLSVDEVKELTPVVEQTPGERIDEGFAQSLEDIKEGFTNFGVWFVVNLPKIFLFLLPHGIAAIIIVTNVKKARKKKLAKKEALANANPTPVAEEKAEEPSAK